MSAPEPQPSTPLLQHLEELRTRMVRALLAALVGFGVCYWQIQPIFSWLVAPLRKVLPESPLVMLKLTEAFMTQLKLAMWAGLLVASPVILYQVWAFVAPGLYRHEKRFIAPVVVLSTVLFALGAAFTYYVVLPFAFKYLILEFATGDVKPMLSMSSYVSSACLFMATFGLVFQIPLVMLMLSRLGIVKASTLARNRKYVLLASFIVGAILSPPDVFSQTIVSLPLFLLFEASIWIMRVSDILVRRRAAQVEPQPESPPPSPAG